MWRTVNSERVVEWAHAILVRGQLNRGTATTGDTRRHVREFSRAVEDAAGPADDAGHILGLRLGGRGDLLWTVFPQNRRINRGRFRVWEGLVADSYLPVAVGPVHYYVRFFFNDPTMPLRPTRVESVAEYTTADGVVHVEGQIFDN